VKPSRVGERTRRTRARDRLSDRIRIAIVIGLLLLLEFYLRPSLVEGRGMPDFLLLALLLLAIRQRPGVAAGVGFATGFIVDCLTPAHFGAGILAHVLVGWSAAWGRSMFFPDNLLVNAALFFVGTWVRNLLMLVLSGGSVARFAAEAFVWSPMQALSTTAVGVAVVLVFREWLAIRMDA
jgi:rod shape-determining protein MreD